MLSEFTNRYSGWFDDEQGRELKIVQSLVMDDLQEFLEEHEEKQKLGEYLEVNNA